MNRSFALAALSAALLAPLAAHASPKHLSVQVAVPGLSISYGHPGYGVAVPAYPVAPVYAPVYGYAPAPVYRPAVTYPVAVPYYRPGPVVIVPPRHVTHPHPHRWHEHHHGRGHWR